MKKMVFISVLFLGIALCVLAQEEKKIAAGFGVEWSMNARETSAVGFALSFDYNLPISKSAFATGFTVIGNVNFTDTVVLEFTALFRWYFLGKGYTGWFAQADAGISFISEDGNKKLPAPVSIGVRTGYRLPLVSSFFVEPYVRIGYSFLFGIGVIGGMRF